ncbi:hypothetical protein C8R46DRAFT_1034211 [Mycena filopes]|nr:hypothetical protein C8R46DRAFT_1034211 [Mycena filopes]
MPITSTRRTPAHFPGLHVVARNNSLCFPPNILDIQASFETETLLRTHHPLLRDLSEVRVYENRHDATDIAWVLLNMDLTVERIGGRRVYCLPQDKFAWYYGQVHSYLEFDPIWHYLEETKPPQPGRHPPSDPRKGFPLASLPYIKAYFPTSVGNPTGQPIGRQYLTTVTHGFLPSNNLIARAVLGGASLFLTYLPQSFQHAVDVVWAKTERLMGMAMTPTYARGFASGKSSLLLPFPFGYMHDLALIAAVPGKSLLAIVWGSGTPRLSGFTTIEEVLDFPDQPLFYVAPHLAEEVPLPPPGPDATLAERERYHAAFIREGDRQLIVEAREYLWENETVAQTLLWRSPNADMSGASGAPICRALPTDTTASVVSFQSFQARPNVNGYIPYRGGFALPAELYSWKLLPGLALNAIPSSSSGADPLIDSTSACIH